MCHLGVSNWARALVQPPFFCEHPVPPGGRVAWAGLEELSFCGMTNASTNTRDPRPAGSQGIASACLGNMCTQCYNRYSRKGRMGQLGRPIRRAFGDHCIRRAEIDRATAEDAQLFFWRGRFRRPVGAKKPRYRRKFSFFPPRHAVKLHTERLACLWY